MISLVVNGTPQTLAVGPDTPLADRGPAKPLTYRGPAAAR
jgi:hypothetical protein